MLNTRKRKHSDDDDDEEEDLPSDPEEDEEDGAPSVTGLPGSILITLFTCKPYNMWALP